jgi:hypothetical protein
LSWFGSLQIKVSRRGYSEQKRLAMVGKFNNATSGATSGEIACNAKIPVTVYLQGMLTRPELSVILSASREKPSKVKPDLQFNIR